MFGIGGFELFLILLFGFLVFGPDKLPAMAKTLGKAIGKFKSAQEEMNKVIKTEVYDPDSDEPFKNPLEVLSKVGEDSKKKDESSESFSERKARYDKERAAKKAAAEKEAAAATATAAVGAAAEKAEEKAAEKPAEEPAEKPKISADELYGTKPQAKKAPAASDAAAKTETAAATAQPASRAADDKTSAASKVTEAADDSTEEKGE